jgi:hypothetical protein
VNTLCRDCGALETAAQRSERCAACGSPRLVCHAELGSLAVAHVDCDAFYAAVEKRDRPELAETDGVTRLRLVGVGADNLFDSSTADPPTLFDGPRRLECAIDAIRGRLGEEAVQFGRTLPEHKDRG